MSDFIFSKEEFEKFALIVRKLSYAEVPQEYAEKILEEEFGKEVAEVMSFYFSTTRTFQEFVPKDRPLLDEEFSAKIAAYTVYKIDSFGEPDYSKHMSKIFFDAVKEKKIVDLVLELNNMSYLSTLSKEVRSLILSWLFSAKENITDEIANILKSDLFFSWEKSSIALQFIRLGFYDHAFSFAVDNTSDSLRYMLAAKLPIDYLPGLLDSSPDVLKLINERFDKGA